MKKFWSWFVLFTGVTLASVLMYPHSIARDISFGVVGVVVLAMSLYRLEYGVLVVLAELLIGSKGHLLWAGPVSLRMALFAIVLFAWGVECIRRWQWPALLHARAFRYIAPLLLFIAWGIAHGAWIQHYPFARVLDDANNWVFFAFAFPMYDVTMRYTGFFERVRVMAVAGIAFLIARATFFFVVFAAAVPGLTRYLYHFERQTSGGQMAPAAAGMWRIYFWSELFLIPALIVTLTRIMQHRARRTSSTALLLVVCALVLTLFRSFWLGTLVAVSVWVVLSLAQRVRWQQVFATLVKLLAATVIAVLLVQGIGSGLAYLAGGRQTVQKELFTTEEPGIRNRLNQAAPLWHQIVHAPLLGSGYGTTATYKSIDVRNAGAITTTAFELGWFDMAMEIGLLGVCAYLVLLGYICVRAWQLREQGVIIIATLAGFAAVHLVSPYLNHPLGIGFVLFALAFVDKPPQTA